MERAPTLDRIPTGSPVRDGSTAASATRAPASAGRPVKRMLSIVIPAYNEQDNIACIYRRLVPVLDRSGARMGADLQRRPVHRSHRGADPPALRSGPAGQDAALLAQVRPADGDDGRARGRRRRCRRGGRLRSAGPSRADPRARRALAGGLRRRLRAAPDPRRRDRPQAHRRRRRLPADQAHRRRRDPAQHRRLSAHEPPGRRQRRLAEGGPRLPARARRPGRLLTGERPLRPRSACRRQEQVQPLPGIAA